MSPNKVFVNINSQALRSNIRTFRKLVGPKVKVLAVVKSNAYGHGIFSFSKLADKFGVHGFCVDSVIEGEKLRREGIKKPILVLGPTFKQFLPTAAKYKLIVTVSNFDALAELAKSKIRPEFHLKLDTGMRRQGFYLSDVLKAIRKIRGAKLSTFLTGVYTHFASAKDMNYPTFTENQFAEYQKAVKLLHKAGFVKILKHAAATGGTMINRKYHLDAVRIGIGLYGLFPSAELSVQTPKLKLKPVLSWHTMVSEVKPIKAGDFIGYDLTERVSKPSKIAVLPIGYWHGYPRALSGIGEALISGKRARILGRVSMDLIVVDITGIKCKRGGKATLIGKQKGEEITAYEVARKHGASYYEVITRINPLTERVIV